MWYVPVETPTNDMYGGHRPGNGLFGESLVCLDAKTGKRIWHFQTVHHGIWDYDVPAPPILLDVTVDGKRVKAVAQVTKQGFTYVFDRVSGQPVWPIIERPVPQSDVPGEKTSPTQPFPTKPAAFERQGVTLDDLIDFTPELRAEAVKIASRYKLGPLFTPPIVAGSGGKRAVLMAPSTIGGANWQGGAVDPETGILYVGSAGMPSAIAVTKDPKRSSMDYVGGGAGAAAGRAGGAAGMPPAKITGDGLGPQGLPLLKPPYGRITAIDLNSGEHVWMVPNADTPESIKNHPALKGVSLPRTGTPERSGILVTKTLVFAGEGGASFAVAASWNGGGPMFRAYDKKTGETLSQLRLPSNQSGLPMTYMVNGKQYIVVAVLTDRSARRTRRAESAVNGAAGSRLAGFLHGACRAIHDVSLGNLRDARGTRLSHHHAQLAVEDFHHGFDPFLAERCESVQVRASHSNRSRPERERLEDVGPFSEAAVHDNRHPAGDTASDLGDAFDRRPQAVFHPPPVIGDPYPVRAVLNREFCILPGYDSLEHHLHLRGVLQSLHVIPRRRFPIHQRRAQRLGGLHGFRAQEGTGRNARDALVGGIQLMTAAAILPVLSACASEHGSLATTLAVDRPREDRRACRLGAPDHRERLVPVRIAV